MNKRIAKKIVKHHSEGRCCLSWGKISQAFRKLGIPLGARPEIESAAPAPSVAEKEAEGSPELPDLSKMKVSELKALAKERGLKGYSAMKKAELVSALGG